jgi:hypothetical protein
VELLGQSLRYSGTSAIPITIRFQWRIRIILSVLTTFTLILSVIMLAGHHQMSDPFFVVSDLFGGDYKQVTLAQGFICRDASLSDYLESISDDCLQHNTDQIYSDIYLQASGNIIKEVSLFLRANTFSLGDLVLLWGKPETSSYCEMQVFSWSTHGTPAMVVLPRTRYINYYAPIQFICFSCSSLPDWQRELMNDARHGC